MDWGRFLNVGQWSKRIVQIGEKRERGMVIGIRIMGAFYEPMKLGEGGTYIVSFVAEKVTLLLPTQTITEDFVDF